MITAVALRLFPRADVRSVVLAAVESPAQALRLFELLYAKCGARLQVRVFLGRLPGPADARRRRANQRYPAYVLVELADSADEAALNALLESVIGQALEDELCLDAVVSASLAQLQGLWKLREEISEAQRADGPPEARRVPAHRAHPGLHGLGPGPVAGSSPASAPSSSATSATATCTTTCRARPARRDWAATQARPSPTRCWTRSTDTVAASAPSTASASSSAITSCTARIRWSCADARDQAPGGPGGHHESGQAAVGGRPRASPGRVSGISSRSFARAGRCRMSARAVRRQNRAALQGGAVCRRGGPPGACR